MKITTDDKIGLCLVAYFAVIIALYWLVHYHIRQGRIVDGNGRAWSKQNQSYFYQLYGADGQTIPKETNWVRIRFELKPSNHFYLEPPITIPRS